MITVTAASATTSFTLTAALAAGGYTAGSQTPPFADDGYGGFLTDATQTLFGHQPALCAAFNLTGAEFALITTALGFDASTPLTLANVSAVFRVRLAGAHPGPERPGVPPAARVHRP